MENYSTLIDKYKDSKKVGFVIGCGPSLHQINRDKYWHSMNEHIICSVNSSIMLFKWNSNEKKENRYWISNDSLCRRWTWWKRVLKSKCIKIVRDSWEKYEKELPGFLSFQPRPTKEDTIKPENLGLCYCSSVPTSIDLCIQMGLKKIFLLGVDQYAVNGKHHFWQYYPKKHWPKSNPPAQGPWEVQKRTFKYNNMAYKALQKFAEYKKVKIYNCNPKSKVDIFEKINFIDVKEIIRHG